MKIAKSLRLALRAILLKAGEVETEQGKLIFDEDELAVGIEVFVEKADEEGNTELVPAEDGEYKAEGKTIVVAEGKVAEIKEDAAEEEKPAEEPAAEEEVAAAEEVMEPAADDVDEPAAEEAKSAEERIAELENRIAAFADGVEKILNAIAGMDERLAAVEDKIAALEEPAADAIKEEAEEETPKSKLSYLK